MAKTREEWIAEEAVTEQRLAEALGRQVIAYEQLVFGLRTLLEAVLTLGVFDYEFKARQVEPAVRMTIGQLAYGGLLSALQAAWDTDRIGAPLTSDLLKELRRADEERNRLVHANWSPYGDSAWRVRFVRYRSSYETDAVDIDAIVGATERCRVSDARIWELHSAVEEAEFREADEYRRRTGLEP